MESPEPLAASYSSGSETAWEGLFFVVTALFLGIFTKHLLAWTKLPFTGLLLVWGALIGIGNETYTKHWDYVSEGVAVWEGIEPTFFLSLLLPIIIYAAAINMHWHTLRRCISQVLLLAGPGVVIGTALTALFVQYAFPYNWTWTESLLFGAMLSATDPVAVIALLQEVGAEKELRTVIEGESLFNDGSAYVLFLLFEGALQGQQLTPGSVIKQLCQLTLGGPAVGAAFGLCMVIWLRYVYNSAVVEVTMTIVAALGAFIVGNEMLGVSGVLAVLCLGIWMLSFGAHHISREVQEPLNIIWEELEFIANTLIFILAGVIIAGNIYRSENNPNAPANLGGRDYGYAVLLWVALLAIRLFIFVVMYPILKMTGYSITWRKVLVMVWAGLRGAVGLALALFILLDNEISDAAFRVRAFFFMGLIAAITIVVQGTTTGLLLQWLGLTRRVSVKRTFLNNVVKQVERHGSAHFKNTPHSYLLDPQNWKDITRLTSIDASTLLPRYKSIADINRPFTDIEQEGLQQSISAEDKRAQLRQETRARLLRAVQQTYEDIFERAHVAPTHLYKLKNSANRALDHTRDPLCDWNYLDDSFRTPTWLQLLQRLERFPLLSRPVRTQLFQHLENQASLMLAFHYAHTDAVQSMQHFDLQPQHSNAPSHNPGASAAVNGDASQSQGREANSSTAPTGAVTAASTTVVAKEQIIKQVMEESKQQQHMAEHRLHALRRAYPEVLASVRTKQIALEVLLIKEAYVHELQASGLVDSAEMGELIYLVERQKKRLHFGAPTLRVPPLSKELWQHPLLKGLTAQERAQVAGAAKARVFSQGRRLHTSKSGKAVVLFVIRGAVGIHQDPSTANAQQEAAAAASNPHQQEPTALAQAAKSDTHAVDGQSLNQQDQERQMNEELDARGYVLGLSEVLHEPSCAGATLFCQTAVEAYIIPATVFQGMLAKLPAMRSRALQLCAAQLAQLHKASLPVKLSWADLQSVFRKSKLEEMTEGQRVAIQGPAFLMSGMLRLNDVTDAEDLQESQSSSHLTQQGSARGDSSMLLGSVDPGSQRYNDSRSVSGPCFLLEPKMEVTCLHYAQLFHLPQDAFTNRPQQDSSSSSEVPATRLVAEADELTAVDTGRWGESTRKPPTFLAHDLWTRLVTHES